MMSFCVIGLSCCGADDTAMTEASDTLSAVTSPTSPTSATTDTTEATTSTTETTGDGSTSNDTMSSEGAPFFLSFSTNVGEITDGESVIFTATMSDPDGFADIAGGTLFAENGAFSYGPFIAAGQEGTYSITVSWSAIDQVESVDFVGASIERTLRAEFFDLGGKSVSKDTTITLSCDAGGACDGRCKDFQVDDEHCGGCGNLCHTACENALCLPAFGECIDMDSGFASCADYCQGVGEQCVQDGCDNLTFSGHENLFECMDKPWSGWNHHDPCDYSITWDGIEAAVRCCCTETY